MVLTGCVEWANTQTKSKFSWNASAPVNHTSRFKIDGEDMYVSIIIASGSEGGSPSTLLNFFFFLFSLHIE